MWRLILALLVAFAGSSELEFQKHSEIFTESSDGVKTIIDPTKPMKMGAVDAYWVGYYPPSMGVKNLCQVENPSTHWDLGIVRFPNGSEPQGIQFGCMESQYCHKYECYDRLSTASGVLIYMSFVGLFILGSISVILLWISEDIKKLVKYNKPAPYFIEKPRL